MVRRPTAFSISRLDARTDLVFSSALFLVNFVSSLSAKASAHVVSVVVAIVVSSTDTPREA